MLCFASSALLHLFFTSYTPLFLLTGEGGRKNISCPRAPGTLAIPLVKGLFAHGLLTVKWLFRVRRNE